MNQRETDYLALRDTYAHLLGKRWTGNRLFGCYEIIRDYYREFLGRELIDFNARKVYAFTDDAINEEDGKWIYKKEWGMDDGGVDFTILEKNDILLFRLYTNPLGGGYSAPKGRAPNHGGVYLGNGFMLHHPYGGLSDIEDLYDEGVVAYQISCVGAIRGNTT